MPVASISVKELNRLLRKEYSMDILVDSLKQLGCDVEDTVEIALYRCPACDALNDQLDREEPARRCTFCGHEQEKGFEKFATDTAIRIDLLADRPDLFNVVGLARALRGYLELELGMPQLQCQPGNIEVLVDPAVASVRPFIVCAQADVPPLDHTALRELMKLQENLHWGVGRDRKLASIGIYNLDTIQLPITYQTVQPTGFTFHPLGFPAQEMTAKQILEEHPKGIAYAHLLSGYSSYPLLIDAAGLVLSMPPIINSEETKCRIGTTRLFIDVTGHSLQAIGDALNILVWAIADLGGQIQNVKTKYPDGETVQPQITPREMLVSFPGAVKWLGVDFTPNEFEHCIRKMRLDIRPAASLENQDYIVSYSTYRSDIRHEVDIFEDAVIGYGIARVPLKLVPTMTVGMERPEERIANRARSVMTGLGFTEIMSLNLQSRESHFNRLRMEPDGSFVVVENPKTLNQEVVRNHLITGIMETLEKNRRKPVPQRIFEIGAVTFLDSEVETGVQEYRHAAFVIIGPVAGYADGRSVLDSLMRELGIVGQYRAVEHPTFIEGRCAEVTNDAGFWARIGEMHPQVLDNFSLTYPIVYCELRLARVW